jgi:hypothetical protein
VHDYCVRIITVGLLFYICVYIFYRCLYDLCSYILKFLKEIIIVPGYDKPPIGATGAPYFSQLGESAPKPFCSKTVPVLLR